MTKSIETVLTSIAVGLIVQQQAHIGNGDQQSGKFGLHMRYKKTLNRFEEAVSHGRPGIRSPPRGTRRSRS